MWTGLEAVASVTRSGALCVLHSTFAFPDLCIFYDSLHFDDPQDSKGSFSLPKCLPSETFIQASYSYYLSCTTQGPHPPRASFYPGALFWYFFMSPQFLNTRREAWVWTLNSHFPNSVFDLPRADAIVRVSITSAQKRLDGESVYFIL